jgi:PTS system fructose-specific IIC component/PTS system nitrogen regulatory IIA component
VLLSEVFTKNFIKINLESEDKDEVFEEMVDVFCSVKYADAREEILMSLRERERQLSTGIQKGIAIPHGKLDVINDLYGVLGISKKGVDYDSLDGENVHLIFMILVPKDSEKHLRVLKHLAHLFAIPEFYTDMLSQNSVEGAYNTLKTYEDRLIESF